MRVHQQELVRCAKAGITKKKPSEPSKPGAPGSRKCGSEHLDRALNRGQGPCPDWHFEAKHPL